MICKLCDHEIDELVHDIKHFVLDYIKKSNPEWVKSDGACPQCVEHYANLDNIVEVVKKE